MAHTLIRFRTPADVDSYCLLDQYVTVAFNDGPQLVIPPAHLQQARPRQEPAEPPEAE